ncbi:acyltransferase [Salinibaculum salinum]|uniref:acyltransferase n=1 Tax=Salinibaculum salinum TaxID=3131996 RepID=UPI0030EB2B81
MPSLRSDPLDELVVPDGTHVEEHDLVTDGDVIVGGQSTVEFGVRGNNVIAGERVQFGGHIEAEGDCRLDMWCDVADNVLVGENAYLGERVHIAGQLKVAGDLDIGDDVDIEDGFEANGWIVIRNPMPTIVFLFVYLSQLLRIGEEEAAEEVLSEMMDDEREHEPVVVPRSTRVSDDAWRVSTPARIGDNCRLHGNIRAQSLVVGRDTEIFGSLRGKEGVTVGAGTQVTGNVTTRDGTIRIGPDTDIRGDVSGEYVEIHQDAAVEGAIRAREEMTMVNETVLDDSVIESVDVAETDEAESAADATVDEDSSAETDDESDAETDEDTETVSADDAD